MAATLEAHGCFETVRRELREWTCDDGNRIGSWVPEMEVDAAACFPELLRWVRALWTPCEEEAGTEPPLVLALDPTHQRDEWVALVVSVVYRAHAIPVAWHVVAAQARESWLAHYDRLLRQLASAVPDGTPMHVLCDRGLDSRDLWRPMVELGWHPVLRYSPHITFRPTGGERMPVRTLGAVRARSGWGRGLRAGSPARHAAGAACPEAEGPLLGPVDRHPAGRDRCGPVCLPSLDRAGLPRPRRGDWQWGRTRRRDPVRVARHLLVLAVATLRAGHRPPAEADPDSLLPRRFSLLRQGAACIRRLLVRHRLWARVWLTPRPGPDRVGGLRASRLPSPDATPSRDCPGPLPKPRTPRSGHSCPQERGFAHPHPFRGPAGGPDRGRHPLRLCQGLDFQHSICVRCQDMEGSDCHSSCGNQGLPSASRDGDGRDRVQRCRLHNDKHIKANISEFHSRLNNV